MRGIILTALLTLAVAAGAGAQAPGPQPQGRGLRGELAPNEVVAMLDAYAVVQAQRALQLTDEQYGPFVSRLNKLHEARRRNQQARNQIIFALRKLAGPQRKPPYDEPAIREHLRTLRQHDAQSAAELAAAYAAVDEVIDIAQQARFRIFEETLERRKLDLLMRARQAARRGGTR